MEGGLSQGHARHKFTLPISASTFKTISELVLRLLCPPTSFPMQAWRTKTPRLTPDIPIIVIFICDPEISGNTQIRQSCRRARGCVACMLEEPRQHAACKQTNLYSEFFLNHKSETLGLAETRYWLSCHARAFGKPTVSTSVVPFRGRRSLNDFLLALPSESSPHWSCRISWRRTHRNFASVAAGKFRRCLSVNSIN